MIAPYAGVRTPCLAARHTMELAERVRHPLGGMRGAETRTVNRRTRAMVRRGDAPRPVRFPKHRQAVAVHRILTAVNAVLRSTRLPMRDSSRR